MRAFKQHSRTLLALLVSIAHLACATAEVPWSPGQSLQDNNIEHSFYSDAKHIRLPQLQSIDTLLSYQGNCIALATHHGQDDSRASVLIANANPADSTSDWKFVSEIPLLNDLAFKMQSGESLAAKENTLIAHSSQSSQYAVSNDGKSWTVAAAPARFLKVHANDSYFFGITFDQQVYASTDGLFWTHAMRENQLADYAQVESIKRIDYSNGWLIASPDNKVSDLDKYQRPILVSDDAKNWIRLIDDIGDADAPSDSDFATLIIQPDQIILSLSAETANAPSIFSKTYDLTLRYDKNANTWSPFEKPRNNSLYNLYSYLYDNGGQIYAIALFEYEKESTDESSSLNLSLNTFRTHLIDTGLRSSTRAAIPFEKSPRRYNPNDRDHRQRQSDYLLPIPRSLPIIHGDQHIYLTRGPDAKPNQLAILDHSAKLPPLQADLRKVLPANVATFSGLPQIRFETTNPQEIQALQSLIAKADQADPDACWELYKGLNFGSHGLHKNRTQSQRYLAKASQIGHAQASSYLGAIAFTEKRDRQAAKRYFDRVAATGDSEETLYCARVYHTEEATPDDLAYCIQLLAPLKEKGHEKATLWTQVFTLEIAIGQGDIQACRDYLELYEAKHDSFPIELIYEPSDLLEHLAANGDTAATEKQLEAAFANRDNAQIAALVKQLHASGSLVGAYHAANFMFNGNFGYPRDPEAALQLFAQNATQDHLPSIELLSIYYATGGEPWALIPIQPNLARQYLQHNQRLVPSTPHIVPLLQLLDRSEQLNAQALPLDSQAGPLEQTIVDLLAQIQAAPQWTHFPEAATIQLFDLVWHDAQITPTEQDLLQEIGQSSSIQILNEFDEALPFTKTVAPEIRANWQQIFPRAIQLTNINQPILAWNASQSPGPLVHYSRHAALDPLLARKLDNHLYQMLQAASQEQDGIQALSQDLQTRARAGTQETNAAYARLVYASLQRILGQNPQLLQHFAPLKQN